jgi:hypothetical protein
MTTQTETPTAVGPLAALTRDIKEAVRIVSPDEARFLVDAYYTWQDQRKRTANQQRALGESNEPHAAIVWLEGNASMLERSLKTLLKVYADHQPIGVWSQSITGIGPVISAGLMAHIDIEKAPTVGHIWRFGGQDPTQEWYSREKAKALVADYLGSRPGEVGVQGAIAFAETLGRRINLPLTNAKGEPVALTVDSLSAWTAKRPWNADLKTLIWKIGESFVKVSGRDDDVYGKLYLQRKAQEIERNDAGDFADQAAAVLERKKIGKGTEAYGHYSKGKLPPAHIHARAKRWAVKLFLSAFHEALFFSTYNELPPKPYILTKPEHVHYIEPPNMDVISGWTEARAAMPMV